MRPDGHISLQTAEAVLIHVSRKLLVFKGFGNPLSEAQWKVNGRLCITAAKPLLSSIERFTTVDMNLLLSGHSVPSLRFLISLTGARTSVAFARMVVTTQQIVLLLVVF